jgi:hypothetical protein
MVRLTEIKRTESKRVFRERDFINVFSFDFKGLDLTNKVLLGFKFS